MVCLDSNAVDKLGVVKNKEVKLMSFILKCNNCGSEQKFESGDSYKGDSIDVDITEWCNALGCTVETIDMFGGLRHGRNFKNRRAINRL